MTIVEFADLMCPACREMHQRLILFMARNTGKVRLLYHPFPLTHFEGHEDSEYAATLAEQLDGKDFWNFVSAVYGLSEKPTRATLDKLFATQPGKRAMDAGAAAKQVKADIRIGEGYGVKLTPTYILFINGHPESVASSINLKEVIKEPKYYRIFASKPKPKKPAN